MHIVASLHSNYPGRSFSNNLWFSPCRLLQSIFRQRDERYDQQISEFNFQKVFWQVYRASISAQNSPEDIIIIIIHQRVSFLCSGRHSLFFTLIVPAPCIWWLWRWQIQWIQIQIQWRRRWKRQWRWQLFQNNDHWIIIPALCKWITGWFF